MIPDWPKHKKIFPLAEGLRKYFFASAPQKTFLINLIQDELS
jgi:hypothetical protein